MYLRNPFEPRTNTYPSKKMAGIPIISAINAIGDTVYLAVRNNSGAGIIAPAPELIGRKVYLLLTERRVIEFDRRANIQSLWGCIRRGTRDIATEDDMLCLEEQR